MLTYQVGNPPVISISAEEKYRNFNYALTPTSFNLVIEKVENEDGGVYTCTAFGANPVEFEVSVEGMVFFLAIHVYFNGLVENVATHEALNFSLY